MGEEVRLLSMINMFTSSVLINLFRTNIYIHKYHIINRDMQYFMDNKPNDTMIDVFTDFIRTVPVEDHETIFDHIDFIMELFEELEIKSMLVDVLHSF